MLTRILACAAVVLAFAAGMAFLHAGPSAFAGPPSQQASVSAALNVTALRPGEGAVLAVVIDIKSGFHAQSNKPFDDFLIPLTVSVDPADGVIAGPPQYPPGAVVQYPALGKLSVYSGRTIVYLPLRVREDAAPGPVRIDGWARYQICDDQMCFAPQRTSFSVETRIVSPGEPAAPANAELFAGYEPRAVDTRPIEPAPQPPPRPAELGGASPAQPPSMSLAAALATAFLAGLIFNAMPCVLPVLPLKAMSFYEIAQHSRARSVLLSCIFSLGIIAVFAALAVLMLPLKLIIWSELPSKPWFIWTIVIILLTMGLGMFGAFTVSLPASVYSIAPRHDTYTGNFLFGMLAAVLATPCTAPLLPTLLAWAASQPVVQGIGAMLTVGVGMAAPYVVLSAFPQLARRFPRSGPWAELVKHMLGFLLFGAAAYFGGASLISGGAFWLLLIAVSVWGSLYLLVRTAQIAQSAAAVMVATAIAVAVCGGVTWWAARSTGLVARLTMGAAAVNVDWVPYSDEALAEARRQGRPVLVKFTANWCLNCQYIEATVFNDARAVQTMRQLGVVPIKADLTHDTAAGWPLLRELSPVGGIPLTAIWAPGAERPVILASVYTAATLVQMLEGMQ
jgi:thiol:disulfide interchange protein